MSSLISGVWGAMGELCCIRRNKENLTDSMPQDQVHQVIFGHVSPNVFDFLLKSENLQMRACSSSLKAGSRLYFWTEIEKFFEETCRNALWEEYTGPCENTKAIYKALGELKFRYSLNNCDTVCEGRFQLVKHDYPRIKYIARIEGMCVDCDSRDSLLNLENIRRIKRLVAECDGFNAYYHQSYKKYLTKFLSIMVWMRGEYLPYQKALQPSRCNIM